MSAPLRLGPQAKQHKTGQRGGDGAEDRGGAPGEPARPGPSSQSRRQRPQTGRISTPAPRSALAAPAGTELSVTSTSTSCVAQTTAVADLANFVLSATRTVRAADARTVLSVSGRFWPTGMLSTVGRVITGSSAV